MDRTATGFIPERGENLFFFCETTNNLCGSPSLLLGAYRGLFPQGLSGRDVKVNIHHIQHRS